MALTPGQEGALAPKPTTVSSTSSLDTSGSVQHDFGIKPTKISQQSLPVPTPPVISGQPVGTDDYSMQNVSFNHPGAVTPSGSNQLPPSSISLVPRASQLHLTPSTGVVVPSALPTTNTVPEFLYQLTKMLSDHNRDVIEWSNGKIEVHNPHKLQAHVLNRYFRHSKFASFQRQLNYFGFRKLAGKGKMAPCSYVNDATTNELGSLLLVKRKTGNEPKAKAGKIRTRENRTETLGVAGSRNVESTVNPVLADILYRSASDQPNSNATATQPPGVSLSQQDLARVAVGRGIRHSFTVQKTVSSTSVPPLPTATPNPLLPQPGQTSALSALQNNFRNSLQDFMSDETTGAELTSNSEASSSLIQYTPGSLRRDDSLVDLAMIPIFEDGAANPYNGYTFVDFPWQDPNAPSI